MTRTANAISPCPVSRSTYCRYELETLQFIASSSGLSQYSEADTIRCLSILSIHARRPLSRYDVLSSVVAILVLCMEFPSLRPASQYVSTNTPLQSVVPDIFMPYFLFRRFLFAPRQWSPFGLPMLPYTPRGGADGQQCLSSFHCHSEDFSFRDGRLHFIQYPILA